MAQNALDIIIPARGETIELETCLVSVINDSQGLDLRVIVVANGPDRMLSEESAERIRALANGIDLIVMSLAEGSKIKALNAGDSAARVGSRLYLDADIELLPGSLGPIARALSTDSPRLVAPPRVFAPARTLVTRHFRRVFATLPAVRNQVVGAGSYAVNSAGRARWPLFPNVTNDDAFVRSRFRENEQELLTSGGSVQRLPEGGPALIQAMSRWSWGNAQLRHVLQSRGEDPDAVPGAGFARNLGHVLTTPGIWTAVPTYFAIKLLAKLSNRRPGSSGWDPVRS